MGSVIVTSVLTADGDDEAERSAYAALVASMIARARHIANLTSEDFAAALRQEIGRAIPRQSLSEWENGQRIPKADILLVAAKIAGTTVDALAGPESMEDRLTRLEERLRDLEGRRKDGDGS